MKAWTTNMNLNSSVTESLSESFTEFEKNDSEKYFCHGINQSEDVPDKWKNFFMNDMDLLCVTNSYWLTFDPPSHTHHMIVLTAYCVLMFLGCVGNGLVIYIFSSSRVLRTPSNLFILNLAVSDFFLHVTIFILIPNSVNNTFLMGRLGCSIYGFFGGLTGTCSIMTLAAISLDRYLVITFPLDPFKKLSFRQVMFIIASIWLYAAIFAGIPLLGIEGISYTPEGYLTTCSFDYLSDRFRTKTFILCFFVAAWVIPLGVITYSYTCIIVTVAKQEAENWTSSKDLRSSYKISSRNSSDTIGPKWKTERDSKNLGTKYSDNSIRHRNVRKKKATELKLTRIAFCIVGLWFVAWTPYATVALLGIFDQKKYLTPIISIVPALFCKCAACFDPYIYALSHPRCKNELKKRIIMRCHRKILKIFKISSDRLSRGYSEYASVSSLCELETRDASSSKDMASPLGRMKGSGSSSQCYSFSEIQSRTSSKKSTLYNKGPHTIIQLKLRNAKMNRSLRQVYTLQRLNGLWASTSAISILQSNSVFSSAIKRTVSMSTKNNGTRRCEHNNRMLPLDATKLKDSLNGTHNPPNIPYNNTYETSFTTKTKVKRDNYQTSKKTIQPVKFHDAFTEIDKSRNRYYNVLKKSESLGSINTIEYLGKDDSMSLPY